MDASETFTTVQSCLVMKLVQQLFFSFPIKTNREWRGIRVSFPIFISQVSLIKKYTTKEYPSFKCFIDGYMSALMDIEWEIGKPSSNSSHLCAYPLKEGMNQSSPPSYGLNCIWKNHYSQKNVKAIFTCKNRIIFKILNMFRF